MPWMSWKKEIVKIPVHIESMRHWETFIPIYKLIISQRHVHDDYDEAY